MDKLRKCPFCGGEAEINKEALPKRLNTYDCVDDYTTFFIGCKKCKASGGLWIGIRRLPDAIKSWNTRVGDNNEAEQMLMWQSTTRSSR